MGALSNGDALSGAIGAIIGEVMGEGFAAMNPEAFDPTHEAYDPDKYADYVRNGTALAQISAATIAAILGQDTNAAANAAQNAVSENAFAFVRAVPVAITAAKIGWEIYAIFNESEIEMAKDYVCDHVAEKLGCDPQDVEIVYEMGMALSSAGKAVKKGGAALFKTLAKKLGKGEAVKIPTSSSREKGKAEGASGHTASRIKVEGPTTTPSGRRNLPGVASHDGTLPREATRANWIRGSDGNAAKIPAEVAEKLSGRTFKNFDHFRKEFWIEVSKNPKLSAQFIKNNRKRMSQGKAPIAPKSQHINQRKKFELDHMQELQHGGNVYDMNNIIIRSPLNHMKGK